MQSKHMIAHMNTETQIPTESLPLWMRQSRRGVDWGIMLVIAFSLIAALPFFLHDGLPGPSANENHAFMVADISDALREGRLHARWSPHTQVGYGAPIPHYYPVGAAYLAAVIDVLITNDILIAMRVIYILATLMAGTAIYVFVTRWLDASHGVLASLLYVYSPYLGIVAPEIIGDLPGMVGLALIPALLWAVSRLLVINRPMDVALVALAFAGLILTDIRATLIGVLMALALMLWYTLNERRYGRAIRVVVAHMLGAGISAFFWLPARIESTAVTWREPIIVPRTHLTLPELFTPLVGVDPAAIVTPPQLTLGVVLVAFALIGLVTLIVQRRLKTLPVLCFGLGMLWFLIGLLIYPHEIWLLGPMTLCFAVAGSGAASLRRWLPASRQRVLLPTLLIVIVIGSLPMWLPLERLMMATDPADQIRYEQQGFGTAVLPAGWYVPTTVPESLGSNRFLTSSYQIGSISRIPPDQIFGDVQITELPPQTHGGRLTILSSKPFDLPVLAAYFPGWHALLNDIPLALAEVDETGLIVIDIPVTRNGEVTYQLGPTLPRLVAWTVTWLTAAILLLLTRVRFIRQKGIPFIDDLDLFNNQEARLLAVLLASFVTIMLLSITPDSPINLRPRPNYQLENTAMIQTQTEVGLEIISVDFEGRRYAAGQTLDFTIFWRTLRFLQDNYQVSVYLYDINRQREALRTALRHPGDFPTRRWPSVGYVRDRYTITLPDDLFSGNYQIGVEVYNCEVECLPEDRATFFDSSGDPNRQVYFIPDVITITSE